MNMYGSTILLQHEYAQSFFEEAMCPDIEELERRDAFLTRLQQECPIHTEGTDLVTEIPDVDIAMLLSDKSSYVSVNVSSYHKISINEIDNEKYRLLAYDPRLMLNVAA